MAAYENLTSEQMRGILKDMQSKTGVSIRPGVAHLPTGHVVQTKQFEYVHTRGKEEEPLVPGIEKTRGQGNTFRADVPLKYRKAVNATLNVSSAWFGDDNKEDDPNYSVHMQSAPWGLYSGGKFGVYSGDDWTRDKDYEDIRGPGGKAHVDKVLRDNPGNDPMEEQHNALEGLKNFLKERGVNPEELSPKKRGDHFLEGSVSHLKVHNSRTGAAKNPRYFNLYTGEFEDHILN